MSLSSTKTVAPGDPTVTGPVNRTGSSARSAAMPRVDGAGIPFQVEDPAQERRQGGDDGTGNGGSSQRQRAIVVNRDFGPLLNRAAAYTATEPPVGQESGPVIRVYFADVLRGVKSYEFSMRAIAANDRATGLARGSHYSRYY